MNKPTPITHNGTLCGTCTNGTTTHANNVHCFVRKGIGAGWQVCPVECQHPLAVQPVGRKFQAINAAWASSEASV